MVYKTIMSKAQLILKNKIIHSNGDIEELVIWKLPKKTKYFPKGIKYRLFYGNSKGECLVRYDNERGKGHHKHFLENEYSYDFQNVEQLINDFIDDINKVRRRKL